MEYPPNPYILQLNLWSYKDEELETAYQATLTRIENHRDNIKKEQEILDLIEEEVEKRAKQVQI